MGNAFKNYKDKNYQMDPQPKQAEKAYASYFLFINVGSGGNLGKQMMDD